MAGSATEAKSNPQVSLCDASNAALARPARIVGSAVASKGTLTVEQQCYWNWRVGERASGRANVL